MRSIGRLGGVALMLGMLATATAYAADAPAPELPVAGSGSGPVYLEDYRGLITVLCFFDDDCG
ncbi:MAG TPA: hypothetical protein PK280_10230 [Planctomycetota bacterium]|nr:hypothetical protein [Planctomycetota bacterium]